LIAPRACAVGALIAGSLLASACVLASPSRAIVGSGPANLGAQTVTFSSASGSDIHAWLVRGQPGGGAVLLLHGVGSNRTAMLARSLFLKAQGYTVLALDFQAHGESPGEHVTFGALESLDASAAVAFLRKAVPSERIGVIGVSMGGAAVLLGQAPLNADAMVLESVYPTIRQATSDRLATWFGPFAPLGRLLAPAVIDIVGSDIGVREDELQPIDHIGDVRAPIMMLSGTDDPYTPMNEADSLYARAPEPKTLWAVKGAGHEDLHAFAPLEYERRVGAFLARYLRRQSTVSETSTAQGAARGRAAPQP
jgi:fermentation-respiration switch protein FrsA (DUF1100 family)